MITALELLAVIIGLDLWKGVYRHRRVFIAVDNEGAKNAIINSNSVAPVMRALLRRAVQTDAAAPAFRWFLRVPSPSNWADAPSRGEVSSLERAGAVRVRVHWRRLGLEELFYQN